MILLVTILCLNCFSVGAAVAITAPECETRLDFFKLFMLALVSLAVGVLFLLWFIIVDTLIPFIYNSTLFGFMITRFKTTREAEIFAWFVHERYTLDTFSHKLYRRIARYKIDQVKKRTV